MPAGQQSGIGSGALNGKSKSAAPAPAAKPQGVRALQAKVKSAAQSYLSAGNAAIDKDWSEF